LSKSRKKNVISKVEGSTAKDKRRVSKVKRMRARIIRRYNSQMVRLGEFEDIVVRWSFKGRLELYFGNWWIGNFKDDHGFCNNWTHITKDQEYRKARRK
jgi:hypothetical protein